MSCVCVCLISVVEEAGNGSSEYVRLLMMGTGSVDVELFPFFPFEHIPSPFYLLLTLAGAHTETLTPAHASLYRIPYLLHSSLHHARDDSICDI